MAESMIYLVFFLFCGASHAKEPTFKASVYELKPTVYEECFKSLCDEEKAMKMMMENVNKMKEPTEEAAKQGAKIIVFPEYALTADFMARKFVYPFIQEISDEEEEDHVNLCIEATDKRKIKVLKEFSCMAMRHQIYVVANLITKIKCNNMTEENCRDDGWSVYNTNVAFSTKGNLVAVYHKYHLYQAEALTIDRPPQPEVVTFDTEFGRIGTMICFDLFFKEPMHSLLKKGASTIAYSAYWDDIPPWMTGIQYHSMVANKYGINVLSAESGFQTGSGIYSSDGVHGLFYEGVTANQSRLIVAEVPVSPKEQPPVEYGKFENNSLTPDTPGAITIDTETTPMKEYLILKESGVAKICHKKFCCESNYTKDSHTNEELFALNAFAGIVDVHFVYLEMCAILRCASHDPNSCGSPILNSTQKFSHLTLAGTFTTNNVFSSVLLDGVQNMDLAYDRITIRDDGLMEYNAGPEDGGLICAQLSGRPFHKDPAYDYRAQNNGSSVVPAFLAVKKEY